MIAPKSSGSSLAESAVDPTRSQNSTVSWRRSIGRESRVIGTTAGEPARNSLPQSPQNLFRAGFAVPQARQRRTTAAPHRPQNFLCFGTSAAQFVQCIRTSTEINTPLQCARSRAIYMILVTTTGDASPGSVMVTKQQRGCFCCIVQHSDERDPAVRVAVTTAGSLLLAIVLSFSARRRRSNRSHDVAAGRMEDDRKLMAECLRLAPTWSRSTAIAPQWFRSTKLRAELVEAFITAGLPE